MPEIPAYQVLEQMADTLRTGFNPKRVHTIRDFQAFALWQSSVINFINETLRIEGFSEDLTKRNLLKIVMGRDKKKAAQIVAKSPQGPGQHSNATATALPIEKDDRVEHQHANYYGPPSSGDEYVDESDYSGGEYAQERENWQDKIVESLVDLKTMLRTTERVMRDMTSDESIDPQKIDNLFEILKTFKIKLDEQEVVGGGSGPSRDELMELLETTLETIIGYLPDSADKFWKFPKEDHEGRLNAIVSGIKSLDRSQREATKKNSRLQRELAAKDRKLEESEATLLQARDSRGAREEKLSREVQELELELAAAKKKADDRVKKEEEGQARQVKVTQRLHDKIREKETQLSSKADAHNILKLDYEATCESLRVKEAEVQRLKKQQLESEGERANIANYSKEIKGLKTSLNMAKTNVRIEQDKMKTAKASLEAKIEELEKECRIMRRSRGDDAEHIFHLSQQRNDHRDELMQLRETMAAMEQIQAAMKVELEKSDNTASGSGVTTTYKELASRLGDLNLGLSKDLDEESDKSKAVEAKMSVIRNIANK